MQWTDDVGFVDLRIMEDGKIENGSDPKMILLEDGASPAICRAGYFQFTAEQNFTNGCVQSRGLFRCKSGKGTFNVDGVIHDLEPHDLYILPWNRRISYFPDSEEPMFTGHVHLVPHYREGSEWISDVPHESNEVAFNSPDRSDIDWEALRGVVRFKIRSDEPIALILDYSIRKYLESDGFLEEEGRDLGRLILMEIGSLLSRGVSTSEALPEELRRLTAYVEKGFHLSPTVEDLARVIDRSRSHVLKLFNRHLGESPKDFIKRRQLREARELLLSTTRSIGEIGQMVGFPDPYHFSKWFSNQVGVSPSSYRSNHGPFARRPASSSHKPAPLA